MKDFLISYANADRPWAEWIAWVLEENGNTAILEAQDVRPGGNFVLDMQSAAAERQIVLVLSDAYMRSERWQNVVDHNTLSRFLLFPIRVEACRLTGVLAQIVYLDLVGKSETEAEQTILDALEKRSPLDRMEEIAANDEERLETVAVPHGELKQRRRSQLVQCFVERFTADLTLEMMQIPAGTFLMGSPADEPERLDREEPQHEVTIPAFFMGRYPVTQAQWRFVAALPESNQTLDPDPARFKGDNRPVERVSWFDAVEFCARLSQFSGREYRLPTEAEWEYACRAGTATPFHFGVTMTTDLANYRGTDNEEYGWSGSYGVGPKGIDRAETTPVDEFKLANAWGLSDMHGNVYEWCEDHWHDSYDGAPVDGSAWLEEAESDANRVIRGGSWFNGPQNCRSANRDDSGPRETNDFIGFRVVCASPRTLR